jgi:hypothetical protein
MNIVRVDAAGPADTSHDLSEDVDRHFAPGEIAEGGESDCDCRINVSARNAARNPYTECCA